MPYRKTLLPPERCFPVAQNFPVLLTTGGCLGASGLALGGGRLGRRRLCGRPAVSLGCLLGRRFPGVVRDVPSCPLKLNCRSRQQARQVSATLFAGCQWGIAELLDFLNPRTAFFTSLLIERQGHLLTIRKIIIAMAISSGKAVVCRNAAGRRAIPAGPKGPGGCLRAFVPNKLCRRRAIGTLVSGAQP